VFVPGYIYINYNRQYCIYKIYNTSSQLVLNILWNCETYRNLSNKIHYFFVKIGRAFSLPPFPPYPKWYKLCWWIILIGEQEERHGNRREGYAKIKIKNEMHGMMGKSSLEAWIIVQQYIGSYIQVLISINQGNGEPKRNII